MPDHSASPDVYARRHMRFGWWSLLLFLTLGLGLELLHGFKARMYLDVANETRRLMWTLAHAHGALLGILHVVFGVSLRVAPELGRRRLGMISASLVGASLLLPGGFFLGGIGFYGGDPGLGILLVPIGAALLMAAVFAVAQATNRLGSTSSGTDRSSPRRKRS